MAKVGKNKKVVPQNINKTDKAKKPKNVAKNNDKNNVGNDLAGKKNANPPKANKDDLAAKQKKEAQAKQAAKNAAKAKAEKAAAAAKKNKTGDKVTVKGNVVTTKKKDGTVIKQTINKNGDVTQKQKTTQKGKTKTTSTTKFDGKGNKTSQTTKTTKNGKTTKQTNTEYKDGKVTHKKVTEGSGANVKTTETDYQNGKRVQKSVTVGKGDKKINTVTNYDQDGNRTDKTKTQKINGIETKVKSEYNKDGKITSKVTSKAKDANSQATEVTQAISYKYDNKGNLKTKVQEDKTINKVTTTDYSDYKEGINGTARKAKVTVEVDGQKQQVYNLEQELNKDGKITKTVKFNEAGNQKISETEYDYDKNGNKTKSKITTWHQDGSKREAIRTGFESTSGGVKYDTVITTYDKEGNPVKVAQGTRTRAIDGSISKEKVQEAGFTGAIKKAWQKVMNFINGDNELNEAEAKKELKQLYKELGDAIGDKQAADNKDNNAVDKDIKPIKPIIINPDETKTEITTAPDGTKTVEVKDNDGNTVAKVVHRATDGFTNQISIGDINITDIGTGGCSGNWFANLQMNGTIYSQTGVKKSVGGTEIYTLKAYPDNGTSIICKMEPDGTQSYTVDKGTDGSVSPTVLIDKDNGVKISYYSLAGN